MLTQWLQRIYISHFPLPKKPLNPVGKGDACSSVSFTLVILFIYLFSYLFMSGNGTPSTDMLQYSLQNVHFAAIPALFVLFFHVSLLVIHPVCLAFLPLVNSVHIR